MVINILVIICLFIGSSDLGYYISKFMVWLYSDLLLYGIYHIMIYAYNMTIHPIIHNTEHWSKIIYIYFM